MKKIPSILKSKVLIIKIGSSLLIKNNKFDKLWLQSLVKEISFLRSKKIKIIIVTSGAVSLGRNYLNVDINKKLKINEKQACAACGQNILMNFFMLAFKVEHMKIGQILLTFSETEERRKNLNARETINTLLKSGVIPIINENDSVATEELKFGDNDRLAARVGQIADADTLVLLSDVDGLYNENPTFSKNARLINVVKKIDKKIIAMGSSKTNVYGSGGMKTKIEAAEIAMSYGCNTLICNGNREKPIRSILKKKKQYGTWFIAKENQESRYKRWIAGSINVCGKLIVDDGAFKALIGGSSLLPSGVIKITGEFSRGDIVQVFSIKNIIVGKGIVAYDHLESKLIMGKKTSKIFDILGYTGRDELIHRDNFIVT
jgi:glutamate 5-kinase